MTGRSSWGSGCGRTSATRASSLARGGQGTRGALRGGAGTLLDIDHGTYPYVTSSNTVAGNAAVGAGLGPTAIHSVIGITKAYTTRVGNGRCHRAQRRHGEKLRAVGAEYGATTGRPRRCGWLDALVLRYAARVNGLSGLAMTKLDVLTGSRRSSWPPPTSCPTARRRRISLGSRASRAGQAHLRGAAGWKNRWGTSGSTRAAREHAPLYRAGRAAGRSGAIAVSLGAERARPSFARTHFGTLRGREQEEAP